MTYLLLQTFLLMLAAFFFGALLACMARTILFGGRRADELAEQRSGAGQQPITAAPMGFSPAPAAAGPAGPVSDVSRFERALVSPGAGAMAAPTPAAPTRPVASPAAPASPSPARPAASPAVPVRSAQPASLPPDTLKVTVSTPVSATGGAPAAAAAAAAAAAIKVGAAPADRAPAAPSPTYRPPAQPVRPAPEPPRTKAEAPPAASAPSPSAPMSSPPPGTYPAAGGPSAVGAVAADVRVMPDTAETPGDDLTRIRGIDTALKSRLNALGVRHFKDIAGWPADEVTRVSEALGLHRRIEQDNWIEQAQILAKGADTQYSRRRMDGEAPLAISLTNNMQETLTSMAGGTAVAAAAGKPAAARAEASASDRLQRIQGIDAKVERLLISAGVTRYEMIAGWHAPDVERFERMIGARGRIARENWIEQAQILAKGGETAYARQLERQPDVTPSATRPARLADAIRERSDARGTRPDLSGMRSVRSEAYRGDGAGGAARNGPADDLKRIRGIGVLLEKKLNSLGIDCYEQIANWAVGDIDRVSQMLDFKGRIERENWVEQARILASGGHTEFSRRIDKEPRV